MNDVLREIIFYVVIIVVALMLTQHLSVVVSGSMEPLMYRGDIVGLEKTDFLGIHEFDPNNVKVGDIVVYNSVWFPDPIIHRVIKVTEVNGTKLFIIKGDNNPIEDPYPVQPEQIVARVINLGDHSFIIPKVGYIKIFFSDFLSIFGIKT
ncbi:MAG: signal peptidase I [Methanobrevibacter sp.]|jgi:signal peptidase|nr:signal peptidase I [Candidatus Methanovirga australis]